ncbi:metalloregulator ArsR/SmtB family transcription factor [Chromobacterium sp. Beijing]|uniref:ArsR/SmtB family transcription factor n=1 Tax=Chromobacterium sp. Beijing TaxID=2735795 RepID=UPI001F24DCE7|nr:metalloregulator ArsR/SmtB family transcription factor [Chromobacterium sp. Beijing]UJB30034.1 metalloregulator ArsR/SmtB family transcription factor [Chromobacterium sp. Beijing]
MTSTPPPAPERFADLADLARTLSHAHRLLLLEHIAQSERPVERLAELAGLSIANASQHLQHLKRAGLALSRRDGKRVMYRLGDGPILAVLDALRRQTEHRRAAVRALLDDAAARPETLDGVTLDELLRRLGDGDLILLDVRPADEYAAGHLPGALNLPPERLEHGLAQLSAGAEIIAYCRGPFCVLSTQAVAALRARGLNARRLDSGFPQWKAAGLEVETGAPAGADKKPLRVAG